MDGADIPAILITTGPVKQEVADGVNAEAFELESAFRTDPVKGGDRCGLTNGCGAWHTPLLAELWAGVHSSPPFPVKYRKKQVFQPAVP